MDEGMFQYNFVNHCLHHDVATTATIYGQVTNFPLDRASRVENLVPKPIFIRLDLGCHERVSDHETVSRIFLYDLVLDEGVCI